MERSYTARLLLTLLLVLIAVLLLLSIRQTNHLERLVIDGNQRITAMEQSVARMRDQLQSGELSLAGGLPAGDGDAEYHRRFFRPDEWEALLAPGNLLSPRTDRLRTPGGTTGGTLMRAFITDIPSLHPITENAADVSELYSYIAEGLATRQRSDPDRWVPSLAYRIEVNDDNTEYHVWLKRGVRWHPPAVDLSDPRYAWLREPREVVADDFAFYLEVILNPQVEAASMRNYFANFAGIEIINDHEFIIRWSEAEYTSRSISLGLSPLPRWLYGHDENGEPFDEAELGRRINTHWYSQRAIGTGPYRFIRWDQGGRIRIERNPDYHAEAPRIDALEFRVMGDATARLNNLRAGNLDYIPIAATEYRSEILEGGTPGFTTGELHHEMYEGPAYRYLGWNADGRFFSDRRVRLAMTHAFNRELMIERNMNGLGTIISGPYARSNSAYDQSIEPWPFDLERAAALLDEAGWRDSNGDGVRDRIIDGRRVNFEFSMMTYGHRPEMIAAMEVYREDLRRIGVLMNIQPVEWSIMLQRMYDKDFDAYTGGWALAWETDLYQIWHSSQADEPRSSNRIGFRNRQADRIIEQVRRSFDDDERQRLFHEFHRLVHEEQPYTFWFQMKEVGAWRDRVRDVSFSQLRPFDSAMGWHIAAP